ncbi:hypothetical protein NKOR_04010 [Candidatus Nitrosopumilus koreensis AR1]|uniref:Uncharacterized protein n=1 Tax=Candidatus Nitrosopumilus koreensis AR1 TaxID=1229908 RepID=K0B6C5_9ARCH|nr:MULTISPECIES: hypothetical protein [Nitrosopumilus]AFS80692.1 hypothetical protein NKOR_04010 [Candidatus Nitrosopumilus koreensis AR1]
MEASQIMSWKKLQDEYYKNIEKFEESINSLEKSSNEIKKIYSQVMEKSKDGSTKTRKEFATLWLEHINVENTSSFSEIKDEYETFLKGPLPSVSDYKNFEATLNHKLCQKPISLLDAYADYMKGFFDAWKETWKNKT